MINFCNSSLVRVQNILFTSSFRCYSCKTEISKPDIHTARSNPQNLKKIYQPDLISSLKYHYWMNEAKWELESKNFGLTLELIDKALGQKSKRTDFEDRINLKAQEYLQQIHVQLQIIKNAQDHRSKPFDRNHTKFLSLNEKEKLAIASQVSDYLTKNLLPITDDDHSHNHDPVTDLRKHNLERRSNQNWNQRIEIAFKSVLPFFKVLRNSMDQFIPNKNVKNSRFLSGKYHFLLQRTVGELYNKNFGDALECANNALRLLPDDSGTYDRSRSGAAGYFAEISELLQLLRNVETLRSIRCDKESSDLLDLSDREHQDILCQVVDYLCLVKLPMHKDYASETMLDTLKGQKKHRFLRNIITTCFIITVIMARFFKKRFIYSEEVLNEYQISNKGLTYDDKKEELS